MFGIFKKKVSVKENHFNNEIKDNKISTKDLKDFVNRWNLNNPIDRWWRQKHDIKFNSPEHRVVSFIDMAFEWEEDKLYKKLFEDYKREQNKEKYDPRRGNWLREQTLEEFEGESEKTNEEMMEEFNKLYGEE